MNNFLSVVIHSLLFAITQQLEMIQSDIQKPLVLLDRKGMFPGLLKQKFKIILISEGYGIGVDITKEADKIIKYTGEKTIIRL